MEDADRNTVKETGASQEARLADRAFGQAAQEFGTAVAPAGRRAGELARRCIDLLFNRLEGWVQEREQMRARVEEDLVKKLEHVDPEKIVAPNPRIAVPALQGMALAMDDEQIREMFLNLIAADMNADTKGVTHPGFAAIIKELTPLEARVLAMLKVDAHVFFRIRITSGAKAKDLGTGVSIELPGVDPDDLVRAVSNLDRVGVVEIRSHEYPMRPEYERQYQEALKESAKFQESLKDPKVQERLGHGPGWVSKIERDGIYLTPYGKAFANVCVDASADPKASAPANVVT